MQTVVGRSTRMGAFTFECLMDPIQKHLDEIVLLFRVRSGYFLKEGDFTLSVVIDVSPRRDYVIAIQEVIKHTMTLLDKAHTEYKTWKNLNPCLDHPLRDVYERR